MKKIVYPKCPNTVSGKHSWIKHLHEDMPDFFKDMPDFFNENLSLIPLEHPICKYCEIVDDTVTLKHEEEQKGRIAYS